MRYILILILLFTSFTYADEAIEIKPRQMIENHHNRSLIYSAAWTTDQMVTFLLSIPEWDEKRNEKLIELLDDKDWDTRVAAERELMDRMWGRKTWLENQLRNVDSHSPQVRQSLRSIIASYDRLIYPRAVEVAIGRILKDVNQDHLPVMQHVLENSVYGRRKAIFGCFRLMLEDDVPEIAAKVKGLDPVSKAYLEVLNRWYAHHYRGR